MKFSIRPTMVAEQKYAFPQSTQIAAQTGLVGYLTGMTDSDGSFTSQWFDWRYDLITLHFKLELSDVLNTLRKKDGLLSDRKALSDYCHSTMLSRMETNESYFGVRIDTEKYCYLFRLIPSDNKQNVFCFCYIKDWLDSHMKNAERGIRFVDSRYKEVFRIPDGGKIKIHYSWDEVVECVCRFVDSYHVEVGDHLYHICEFGERMEQNGHFCEPADKNKLPSKCYAYNTATLFIVVIKRGESGYYTTNTKAGSVKAAEKLVDDYNLYLGVSKSQAAAMMAGSIYGWDIPAADPDNYSSDGKLI